MYDFSEKHFVEIDGVLRFVPNIEINYEIMQLIFEAERNIGALARLGLKNHPLKPNILRNSLIRTAHFTTKIEKNILKYEDVESLYDEHKRKPQMTYKEKAKKEVANVFKAYDYLNSLGSTRDFSNINEDVLIKIHSLLMTELSYHPEGYRQNQVSLQDENGDVSYMTPAYNQIGKYMATFFNWLYTAKTGYDNPYSEIQDNSKKVHPLVISAIAHHFIGYIHPFPDGNGRAARAYSTLVAFLHEDLSQIQDAFSIEEFFDRNIEDYYDTLMTATQGDLNPFVMFYIECANKSLRKVLSELQRYDKIEHIREVLGRGHAATMFEVIVRMEDGEVFDRSLFDRVLNASTSSITKNLNRLKDLDVIKNCEKRGEYIVCILD